MLRQAKTFVECRESRNLASERFRCHSMLPMSFFTGRLIANKIAPTPTVK
jgi:hypothetical protein